MAIVVFAERTDAALSEASTAKLVKDLHQPTATSGQVVALVGWLGGQQWGERQLGIETQVYL